MYNVVRLVSVCAQTFLLLSTEIIRKINLSGPSTAVGTVIAKEENRTRRVDKGKSGQALKIAVSGGFGGGILSQILEASV